MRVVPVLFPCDLGSTERGKYTTTAERGAPDLLLDMFEGEGVRMARPRMVPVDVPDVVEDADAPLKLDAPIAKAVAALAETVKSVNADGDFPVILGGDLNDVPESRTLALLQGWSAFGRVGPAAPTFPADAPDRTIDHFLIAPVEAFPGATVLVLDEPVISDHRPVQLDVVLGE